MMELTSIQIIVLIAVALTIIKISFLIFKRSSFNEFTQSYVTSINNNQWLYFSIYYLLSIIIFYFIKTTTDITYTEITATTMFLAFLMNAALIGTNLYKNLNIDNYNWKMITLYSLFWIFIMYKALLEIFN